MEKDSCFALQKLNGPQEGYRFGGMTGNHTLIVRDLMNYSDVVMHSQKFTQQFCAAPPIRDHSWSVGVELVSLTHNQCMPYSIYIKGF